MKRSVRLGVRAIALATLLGATLASAQTQPPTQPQLFGLHREVVKPSMVAAYEASTKEFIRLVQQAPGKLGKLGFTTYMAEDFSYYMVTRIASYDDIPAIYAGFEETAKAVGPAKFGDVMQRNGATVDQIAESILFEDPSLSYSPAKPRVRPEEVTFVHFDVYLIQPGRDQEAQQIAREFRALFEKKGIEDGYRLFTVLTGGDMPAIVVSVDAKDQADYAAANAVDRKKLGPEGEALFARAFALTRRFETINTRVRLDLSLPPVK